MDPHGRAKGFLAHVLKLATTEVDGLEPEPIDIRVRLNVIGEERPPQGVLEGLEARTIVVEHPDVERLVLDAYDGVYPQWRRVLLGLRGIATDRIALDPEVVGRLAKVGKIHPGARLGWTFGGENKAARVDVIDSDPYVDGIVMPCRWDFDRDAPWEPPAKADDDGQADEDA
jgi:hypothetical protein